MGVDSQNPMYQLFLPDWDQLRDTYRGERVVKDANLKYLPATAGMIEDGIQNTNQLGFKNYTAMKVRARFPDSVREAVEATIGKAREEHHGAGIWWHTLLRRTAGIAPPWNVGFGLAALSESRQTATNG